MNSRVLLLEKNWFWETVLTQMGLSFIIREDCRELSDLSSLQMVIGKSDSRFLSLAEELSDCLKIIYHDKPLGTRADKKEICFKKVPYRFEGSVYWQNKDDIFPLSIDWSRTGKWVRKQFYDHREELASERVSQIDFLELFRFARNYIVKKLQNYGKNWLGFSPYPKNIPPFIFRIDTDFASRKDIAALYDLVRKYQISATWFCDVHDSEILQYYTSFKDQEIALHCHKHDVFSTRIKNLENIKRGLDKLQSFGLAAAGFAAPFGDWNPQLEMAMIDCGFTYSSEFSFAYDCLPVIRRTESGRIWQIPIHPICPGRLRRAHYTESEMFHYFQNYFLWCSSMMLPVLIYHHPGQGMKSLIENIFAWIRQRDYHSITMQNYASWWDSRWQKLSGNGSSELFTPLELKILPRNFPPDYNNKYQRNWRWYLQEYESNRGRRYFHKYGFPKFVKEH